jgi:hypothetical protein
MATGKNRIIRGVAELLMQGKSIMQRPENSRVNR